MAMLKEIEDDELSEFDNGFYLKSIIYELRNRSMNLNDDHHQLMTRYSSIIAGIIQLSA
jgi:hypothetical protein